MLRGGVQLRWRIAGLAGLAIALLAVVASVAAFVVVRNSLYGDLSRSLREDVRRVAELYARGGPGVGGASLTGPTGGVIVQLYDTQGSLLAASVPEYEGSEATIPPEVTHFEAGIREWSGRLGGNEVRVALAPFEFGAAAVIADTDFITAALTRLARALLITALILVLLSGLVAYLIATAAIRPLQSLARQARELSADHLEPVRYDGPADELGQLAAALNGLILRLRDALEGQRQFLAETSHELRTPLTGLQGYLARARRRAPPEVQTDLAEASRISEGMARLVNDLLQLSRDQIVRELTPHLVDLGREVVEPVAGEFPGVRTSVEPGYFVLGDPDRLRQLVRNLTANAVRAATASDRVTLSVCGDRDQVVLEVEDNGPGVPEEIRERIFEKFYKGSGGGSGLGLAIVRQLALLHGGSIELESEPGRTVFRVAVPAADAEG